MPSDKEVDVILKQIAEIAQKQKLVIKKVKAKPALKSSRFMEKPLEMTIEGNRIVNVHSASRSRAPCSARKLATLSSMTTDTLVRMATISATSNAFPAGVSASKMMTYRRSRHESGEGLTACRY